MVAWRRCTLHYASDNEIRMLRRPHPAAAGAEQLYVASITTKAENTRGLRVMQAALKNAPRRGKHGTLRHQRCQSRFGVQSVVCVIECTELNAPTNLLISGLWRSPSSTHVSNHLRCRRAYGTKRLHVVQASTQQITQFASVKAREAILPGSQNGYVNRSR